MDNSSHSSASSASHSQQQHPVGGGSSALASASAAPSAAPTVGAATGGRKPPPSREQSQLAKLRQANAKYKELLKLAKERIQEQEGVLEERRSEVKQIATQLNDANQQIDTLRTSAAVGGAAGGSSSLDPNETTILRVCQRIKEDIIDDGDSNDEIGDVSMDDAERSHEIWALVEYETAIETNDAMTNNNPLGAPSFRRHKQWKAFANESALSDYIRRDTGEPLTLPPYSLSPDQSRRMENDANRAVSSISEEFRRFRVRAEVAKKQADATVRALHNSSVRTTRMRIEGQDIESELAQAKTDHVRLAAMRAEMAEQESRWKESYDLLLGENEKLKSSGAEALLAAQWRHRYEACLKEKEDAITNWNIEKEKVGELQDERKKADAGKYESKYRDLKESFRIYRKKAKEIFLAQQQGETGFIPSLHDSGAEVAKISYLKNLMVNYLSADPTVREHMEPAIGTVLNFTEEDLEKVKKQKEQNESWF